MSEISDLTEAFRVGDRVTLLSRPGYNSVIVVEVTKVKRVTRTRLTCENGFQFYLTRNGNVATFGGDEVNWYSPKGSHPRCPVYVCGMRLWQEGDDEAAERFQFGVVEASASTEHRQNLLKKVAGTFWHRVSTEKLERIEKILSEV